MGDFAGKVDGGGGGYLVKVKHYFLHKLTTKSVIFANFLWRKYPGLPVRNDLIDPCDLADLILLIPDLTINGSVHNVKKLLSETV
jgi:hypothetical protein